MAKHDNYKNIAIITLTKINDDMYKVSYDDDDWELCGSSNEILDEIREHMELMKGVK